MATEYGDRLKKARSYAGLTQVGLSEKTGIPQTTISTAERLGNSSGDTPVYAKACGVSSHWLATGEGEMLAVDTPKITGVQDLSMALFNGYIALVKVLASDGKLDAAALANEIGNTLDYRRSNGVESAEQNKTLEVLYEAVLQIEKHQADLAALKADFAKRLQALGKPPGIDD